MFLDIHPSWEPIFEPLRAQIASIEAALVGQEIAPNRSDIFKTFQVPLESIRVLILGQDPYPTKGHANGLAFSVERDVKPLPKSLKNIFIEYASDTGFENPESGDLTPWLNSGVLLMNRILTTRVSESNAHINIGWDAITSEIARALGERNVVAILWGNQAQELQRFFTRSISSPHPSPLSAYRGFFGSRPFTRANHLLESIGAPAIDWNLTKA